MNTTTTYETKGLPVEKLSWEMACIAVLVKKLNGEAQFKIEELDNIDSFLMSINNGLVSIKAM